MASTERAARRTDADVLGRIGEEIVSLAEAFDKHALVYARGYAENLMGGPRVMPTGLSHEQARMVRDVVVDQVGVGRARGRPVRVAA